MRVSTVIPTYNRAHLLERAVGSALAQMESGDEVIVVDDGSTDRTETVVRGFGDRVRYVRTANGGAGAARNRGVREARNPLVAFLDSDDEWLPGKIALQRGVMATRPEVLFAFTDFMVRSASGVTRNRFLVHWSGDYRSWDSILGQGETVASTGSQFAVRVHVGDLSLLEMRSAYVFTSTLIVRREAAGSALHFAEDVPTYEDLECFGRLALTGLAGYLDLETAIQHGHGGSRLTDADDIVCATARLRILPRVWGQDATFLKRYRTEYERALEQARLTRVRELLAHGRTQEARADLREVKRPPRSYFLLTCLPGPTVPPALRLLRTWRKLVGFSRR